MITEVCRILQVSEMDVLSNHRHWHTSTIRQLYWKLLRLNGYTYTEIGRLCDRNHGTIHHGISHACQLIDSSPEVAEMWDKIKHIKRNV